MTKEEHLQDDEFFDEDQLIPYCTMNETTTVETFKQLFEGIKCVRKWRYYYNYNDALRTIDLAYNKGIYDDYVVLIATEDVSKVRAIVEEHPAILQLFAPVETNFLRSLPQEHLIQALGSRHMNGIKLELALKILEESGLTFTEEAIELKKKEQIEKNKTRKGIRTGKLLLGFCFVLMIIIICFYIYFK